MKKGPILFGPKGTSLAVSTNASVDSYDKVVQRVSGGGVIVRDAGAFTLHSEACYGDNIFAWFSEEFIEIGTTVPQGFDFLEFLPC